jgi:hypothetical protein
MKTYEQMKDSFEDYTLYKEIAEYILDNIEDYEDTEREELHHNLFNTDYYIIGTHKAKVWLNGYDTFHCIGYIREYEQNNFGEINTDLADPEKIVNMLVYIIGEEILYDIESLQDSNSNLLNKGLIKKISKEIKEKWL